jgi:hypothetical protein
MQKQNNAVAIFETHDAAEAAIKRLIDSGIDPKKISVVGKGYHSEEHPVGYYNTGDRVKYWGKEGAFWGGIWGLLMGGLFLWVPGFGPMVASGPLVSMIVVGLEGAVLGAGFGALGAALVSAGIPKDSVIKYEKAVKADKYLVLVQGSKEEVEKAKTILDETAGVDTDLHMNS